MGLKDMSTRLQTTSSSGFAGEMFQSKEARAEELFRASTVGLVSADEFKRKRQLVMEADRIEAEKKSVHKVVFFMTPRL